MSFETSKMSQYREENKHISDHRPNNCFWQLFYILLDLVPVDSERLHILHNTSYGCIFIFQIILPKLLQNGYILHLLIELYHLLIHNFRFFWYDKTSLFFFVSRHQLRRCCCGRWCLLTQYG